MSQLNHLIINTNNYFIMKFLITFAIGFLCLIGPSYGQNSSHINNLFVQNEFSENSENDLLFVCRTSINDPSEKKEWTTSVLIDYKDQAHQVKGHYDVSTDEIQILLQNQPRTIFPQKIKAIKVGQMIFVPCEFEGQDALTYGYFQVLSSNKIDLLKRFENNNGMIDKSFYIRKKDEAAKLLKLNNAFVLKHLNDGKSKKYLKNRKLNLKEEKDLVLLFNYYNELK